MNWKQLLRNAADEALKDGQRLENVSFEWTTYLGAPPELTDIRCDATLLRELETPRE